jgi:hypothetical protein
MHLNYTLTVELRYSDLRIIFCNVIFKKLNISQLFTLYPPLSLSTPYTRISAFLRIFITEDTNMPGYVHCVSDTFRRELR